MEAGPDAFVLVCAVRSSTGAVTDFRIVDANARAAALVGDSVSGLVGRSLLAAFRYSDGTGLWEQCCTVLATRRPLEQTLRVPLPNSPGRWVSRSIVPVDDGVAISSRDVTERHQAALALEASEARYRELFEANGAVQLLVDADSAAIVDVNPAAAQFYGWPRASMRSMLLLDLDGTTLAQWRESTSTTLKLPGTRRRAVHRVAQREHRFVETFSNLLHLDGRLLVHQIVQDITEQASAESKLRESDIRYGAVVSSMRDGVVVHDASGAIVSSNPSAERILGLHSDQLMGRAPGTGPWIAVRADGTPWPPESHPALAAIRSGQAQPRALMGVKVGDSALRWLSVSAEPLMRAGDTAPHGAVAVFSDVTEDRLAQERLQEARKLEAIGQLAGGIAHDFNNLLTVIRGAAGFLSESIDRDSPLQPDVLAIESATERAEELTRRLLAVGRRQLLLRARVNLNELVQERVDALGAALPAAISVRVSLAGEPLFASIDRRRVGEALDALIENAVAAMPGGGVLTFGSTVVTRDPPRLISPASENERSEVARPQECVMVEVRDTGIGMPDEVKARLFEPFFSTKPFGGGRGMDLAAVHGLMAQSGGLVECDSADGQGTSVRLLFPKLAIEEATAGSERSESDIARGAAPVGAREVLLVDDDPMPRLFTKRSLESRGYVVIAAASGAEALAELAVRGNAVAAMVTDMTMPQMSGRELIAEVRRRSPTLPIIAVSGYTADSRLREELAAWNVVFLGKPFTPNALSAVLDSLTGSAEASSPR